jgi:hypothetical protein
MAGNSSITNSQTVTHTDNLSFDGTDRGGAMNTDGQLYIGSSSSNRPNDGGHVRRGSLTSPNGTINIGYDAPDITLDANNAGMIWENIGASQDLEVDHGYFCSSGGALSLALPETSEVGDTISVMLIGSTSWTITQGDGQQIRIATSTTTSGAGGSLASQQQGDGVTLVCQAENTIWQVTYPVGGAFLIV